MTRLVDMEQREEDSLIEGSLRPQNFQEYIGQGKVKEQLKIFIEAAKLRDESLDHTLFWGSFSSYRLVQ